MRFLGQEAFQDEGPTFEARPSLVVNLTTLWFFYNAWRKEALGTDTQFKINK